MNVIQPRIDPGSIELYFSGYDAPSLEKVVFLYDPHLGAVNSVRGRSGGTDLASGNFMWSPAVKALVILLLKTKIHILAGESSQQLPIILGETGSFASSLDYAFAKNPDWLSDMFGVSPSGEPYAKKLILRTNPERKRPGPVTLAINRLVLNPSKISVYIADLEVHDAAVLNRLIVDIEAARIFAMGKREPHDPIQAHMPVSQQEQFNNNYSNNNLVDFQPSNRINYHYLTSSADLDLHYLRCVHRRVLDRMYTFRGPGAAQAWIDICNSNRYSHYRQSLDFLVEIEDEIAAQCRGAGNFIGIRNGTGIKEAVIIKALARLHPVSINLVDGSPEMLHLAIQSISKIFNQEINAFEGEFMQPGVLSNIRHQVAQKSSDPATFVLLGNSLCVQNQSELLHRLRESMRRDDKLILGTRVTFNEQPGSMEEYFSHWVMQYDTPEFSRQAMLSLASLGITGDDGVIEFEYGRDRFIPSLYRVEHFFTFSKNFKTSFLGSQLYFAKGERIQLSFFYQYTANSVRSILLAHGFNADKEFINEQGIQIFICTKQES